MDFEAARQTLLIASLEEADLENEWISPALRSRATASATDPGPSASTDERTFTAQEEAFFASRAAEIGRELEAPRPGLKAATSVSNALRVGGIALVIVCLVVGYLTKALGPSGVVSILAFPLLGVMLWNLLAYVLMAVSRLLGKGPGPLIGALVNRLGNKKRQASVERAAGEGPSAGLGKFTARWTKAAGPVFAARTASWLHLGAAALGIGAVFAMYSQGMLNDYQATWESTFLSADSVRGILSVALAPSTWVPGLALPDIGGIEAIRSPGSEGAAAWIHRYALSAALVVIVPRLLLALLAFVRGKRAAGMIAVRPVAPRYFKHLLDERRGVKSVARILPHRLSLEAPERDRLRASLHRHWGGGVWVEFLDGVAFGDEDDFALRASELADSQYIVTAAALSSTPEEESQGALLTALKRHAPADAEVVLWLEDGGFAERFGAERAAERRAEWNKLASGHQVGILGATPDS